MTGEPAKNMLLKDDEDYGLFENPEKCLKYIQELRDELSKEQMEKAAVSLERDKLKVCWEMTMEQLADIREELTNKIDKLQKELTKQVKRKKLLQKLLQEHGKTIQELKDLAEIFFEKNNSLIGRD